MSGRGARERRRLHREEMQLAVREGLSLDEARERLASYRAHAPRLDAPIAASIAQAAAPAATLTAPADAGEGDEADQPWWMRY